MHKLCFFYVARPMLRKASCTLYLNLESIDSSPRRLGGAAAPSVPSTAGITRPGTGHHLPTSRRSHEREPRKGLPRGPVPAAGPHVRPPRAPLIFRSQPSISRWTCAVCPGFAVAVLPPLLAAAVSPPVTSCRRTMSAKTGRSAAVIANSVSHEHRSDGFSSAARSVRWIAPRPPSCSPPLWFPPCRTGQCRARARWPSAGCRWRRSPAGAARAARCRSRSGAWRPRTPARPRTT
jgi:hypothetical protein